MKNESFEAWVLRDDQNNIAHTTAAQLRQVEPALPETLPQGLPILFPTAEVAEAYKQHSGLPPGLHPVLTTWDVRLLAFVMVEAVTEQGSLLVVFKKRDDRKGWEQMPLSMLPGLGKTRFDRFNLN